MKNQPNKTSELQINLAKFEELAKDFISKQNKAFNTVVTSESEMSEFLLRKFKEFIFSDQLNQQKRRQEYFKLKEQLESMKVEFEPELVQEDDEVTYHDSEGEYIAVKEVVYQNCDGCAFINRSCNAVKVNYSCADNQIIWKKK
jgi:hypothetical protein